MRVAFSAVVLAVVVMGASACQDDATGSVSMSSSTVASTTTSASSPVPGTGAPAVPEVATPPSAPVIDPGGAPAPEVTTTLSAPVTDPDTAVPEVTPPRSTAKRDPAQPCRTVTREELQQVLDSSRASAIRIVIGEPQCKEFWAMAWSEHTDTQPQPTGYLFQTSSQGFWHYVTQGSAIDCAKYGVPADIAVMLRGCGR